MKYYYIKDESCIKRIFATVTIVHGSLVLRVYASFLMEALFFLVVGPLRVGGGVKAGPL